MTLEQSLDEPSTMHSFPIFHAVSPSKIRRNQWNRHVPRLLCTTDTVPVVTGQPPQLHRIGRRCSVAVCSGAPATDPQNRLTDAHSSATLTLPKTPICARTFRTVFLRVRDRNILPLVGKERLETGCTDSIIPTRL